MIQMPFTRGQELLMNDELGALLNEILEEGADFMHFSCGAEYNISDFNINDSSNSSSSSSSSKK